jgi:hypothetical protein
MNCCIILSLNYSFVWCTCLKLFKFGLVFEFDLKTIGKIKRKGIRNSREKENRFRPSTAHSSPARPCVPARSLPTPSTWWGWSVGASRLRLRAHVLSLSCGPALSAQWVAPTPPLRARSLSRHRGTPVRSAFSANCRGPARTHTENPSHVACPHALAPFWASPAPALSTLHHFAQAHPLSHSVLAARASQSSASAVPAVQPVRSLPSLLERRPEVRNSLPCSISFNSALLIRPCRSSVALARRRARWLANSASHRAPVLAHSTPLPSLELVWII